jgi:hypothetical protein
MNAKLKTKLETARVELAATLGACQKRDKELTKLVQNRASVGSQVEQLEAQTEKNPLDEVAIGRLSVLREQQRLFDRKVAKLEKERLLDGDAERTRMGNALNAALEAIVEAGQPALDRLTAQATSAFAPFYQQAKLESVVSRCDAALSLKAFLANCGPGPVLEKPARALALLDTLLAGQPLPWEWPGLSPAPTAG